MSGMESIGFLCDKELITVIDDEEVLLTITKNIVQEVESIIYTKYNSREKIKEQCKLVVINLEELYSNRFYPRTYYNIFRLKLNLSGMILEEYILEQFNGTTGYTAFFVCESYEACRKKIREEEDLED